jgi:hypothetical protein
VDNFHLAHSFGLALFGAISFQCAVRFSVFFVPPLCYGKIILTRNFDGIGHFAQLLYNLLQPLQIYGSFAKIKETIRATKHFG